MNPNPRARLTLWLWIVCVIEGMAIMGLILYLFQVHHDAAVAVEFAKTYVAAAAYHNARDDFDAGKGRYYQMSDQPIAERPTNRAENGIPVWEIGKIGRPLADEILEYYIAHYNQRIRMRQKDKLSE